MYQADNHRCGRFLLIDGSSSRFRRGERKLERAGAAGEAVTDRTRQKADGAKSALGAQKISNVAQETVGQETLLNPTHDIVPKFALRPART